MKVNRLLKNTSIALGLASIAYFVFDYYVFSILRPPMIALDPISSSEENLLNWVGVGLLLFLAFNLISLYRLVRHLRKAKRITVQSLFLLVFGILSFLFVFSDVALLSDIGKQYRYNLAQPEWLLVYIIMGFQLIVAAVFTYLHLFGFRQEQQIEHVVRDNNIFLVTQYVGLVCGLMGLSLFSLGFFYTSSWNLDMHVTITSILLLSPYALALVYWLVTKLQEKNRQWYDEKQILDVGRSAFLTLISSVIIMTLLFVFNYNNLGGIVSIIWLPLYLFTTLFIFSMSNLYFSTRY